jgi:hypothetical protein
MQLTGSVTLLPKNNVVPTTPNLLESVCRGFF